MESPLLDLGWPSYQQITVDRWKGKLYERREDFIAEEVPISLIYNQIPHVVMLATPTNLEEFALGFSITEGIIKSPHELLSARVYNRSNGIEIQLKIPEHRFDRLSDKGRNLTGNMYWDVFVSGTVEKANGGGTITWNCTRTREWIAGEGQAHANWQFALTGKATGSRSDGWSYSATVTQSLLKKASCHWIVSGTIDVFPRGYPTIVLDYGTGACDNIVTATINGKPTTIELK